MVADFHRAVWHGQYDAESVTVTVTMALALFNSVELLLLIFTTFSQYRGLYFWSLVVSTIGVISYSNGLLIEYFKLTQILVGLIFDNIGWMLMITGQSLVLYSRLGLILSNQKILQAVKWMIIVDALVFHTSTTILNFGARYGGGEPFINGYYYIENIQMTFFCVQEFLISGIYVSQTIKLLKVISKQRTRQVMWQLFIINVVIVILDIVLLVIQYKNLHIYEQSVKAFVYSVKLKLEFAILGKLVDLVQQSQRALTDALAPVGDFVDRSNSNPTLERTASPSSSTMPWLVNRDKQPIQHIEDRSSGDTELDTVNPGQLEAGSRSRDVGSVSTASRPPGRESDVMYADIVRAISRT